MDALGQILAASGVSPSESWDAPPPPPPATPLAKLETLPGVGSQDLPLAIGATFVAATLWNLLAGPVPLAERSVYTAPELDATAQRAARDGLVATLVVGGGALLAKGRGGALAAGASVTLGVALYTLFRYRVRQAKVAGAANAALQASRLAASLAGDPVGAEALRKAMGQGQDQTEPPRAGPSPFHVVGAEDDDTWVGTVA